MNRFEQHGIVVLLPTYNNGGSLRAVLESVCALTNHVLVVNDGSTDHTAEILLDFPDIRVISYQPNKGKGIALRTGFKAARELGYAYAITLDSDGQHDARDLEKLIDKLEDTGSALIMGARNMNQENVPGKSNFGNRFSNFWYWVNTGISLPDTQTGYRLYPLDPCADLVYFTSRFEFEVEVLVRAAWAGVPVVSTPVSVYYPPANERISHFRPVPDFSRISVLNTFLVLTRFLYILPRDFIRALVRKETYIDLKNELINPENSIAVRSASVGFGVFMGIIPIWGFQMMAALALAILFKMNKALVLISSNISIPPMMPVIIYLSYQLGKFWAGADAQSITFHDAVTMSSIQQDVIQYIYGSIILAFVAGSSFGILTWLWLSLRSKNS